MSRVSERFGTKLAAKTNSDKPPGPGPNWTGSRFSSWKGRRYGRALRRKAA